MWRCSLNCIQCFQQWSFVQAVSCCLTRVRKDGLSWSHSPDTFWSSWLKTGCDDVPVKSLQFAWSLLDWSIKKMKKGLEYILQPWEFYTVISCKLNLAQKSNTFPCICKRFGKISQQIQNFLPNSCSFPIKNNMTIRNRKYILVCGSFCGRKLRADFI